MKYQSLEDIGSAFVSETQAETSSLFNQGEIVYQATRDGFDVDAVTHHCASLVRRTARTIYRRYAVKRTFDEPHPELTWEMHALCAALVDYRQTDEKAIAAQQEAARLWLDRAAVENYSTRTLRAAIQAAGGKLDDKPEILLDGVDGIFDNIARPIYSMELTAVTIHIPYEYYEKLSSLKDGTEVKVTLVRSPSEDKEPS